MKLKMCELVIQVMYIGGEEAIQKVISENPCIVKYAYILHDKDVYTEEDQLENPAHIAGTYKPPHYHIYLHFKDSQETDYTAKWFGVLPNFVNKLKGGWGNAMLYMTHANAPQKYQYAPEEVTSNCDWKMDALNTMIKNNEKKRRTEIIEGIVSGEIRRYNIWEQVTAMEYIKFKKDIQTAFEYRLNILKQDNSRHISVFYMYGGSGTGKTTFAEEYCKTKGLSYAPPGAKNDVVQDYQGQDAIILDELRPSTFDLSDLLLILDNNRGGCVPSRYYNKYLECTHIFITTPDSIEEFFKHISKEGHDPILQLKRRCQTLMKFTEEKIHIMYYDEVLQDYDYARAQVIPNPIHTMHKKERLTEDEIIGRTEDFLLVGSASVSGV